jgi:hypothetical protein
MSEDELEEARAELRREMPHALRNLLAHYNLYIAEQLPHDTKSFNAFHAAGKNALSHMQLLLRLYKILDGGKVDDADIEAQIAAAEASLLDGDSP